MDCRRRAGIRGLVLCRAGITCVRAEAGGRLGVELTNLYPLCLSAFWFAHTCALSCSATTLLFSSFEIHNVFTRSPTRRTPSSSSSSFRRLVFTMDGSHHSIFHFPFITRTRTRKRSGCVSLPYFLSFPWTRTFSWRSFVFLFLTNATHTVRRFCPSRPRRSDGVVACTYTQASNSRVRQTKRVQFGVCRTGTGTSSGTVDWGWMGGYTETERDVCMYVCTYVCIYVYIQRIQKKKFKKKICYDT